MKFASYATGGKNYYGAMTDGGMVPLNDAFHNGHHCLMPFRQTV